MPSQPDSADAAAMSEQPHEAKTPIEKNPDLPADPNPAENPTGQETLSDEDLQEPIRTEDETPEEEEEGECGFCLFMKGGGCKDTFTAWEKCIEEGEKNEEDIVSKCYQETTNLKKCMEAHSDYYAPLLEAEKAAEVDAAKQLEEEKEKESSSSEAAEKATEEEAAKQLEEEKESSSSEAAEKATEEEAAKQLEEEKESSSSG